jgi:hypothetical protein
MSLFEKDLAKEIILGGFLSEHYHKENLQTTRVHDKKLQLKGVDIILEKDGLQYKIDEKAQLHYINKDLPTFALEINYLKNDILKNGWLFDNNKVTEIYAFIFSIHLIEAKTVIAKQEDIKSCEVIFVNRLTLLQALAKNELDVNACNYHSHLLRNNNEAVTKITFSNDFNFQISSHLTERPVNLIVKKSFLKSLGKTFLFKNQL